MTKTGRRTDKGGIIDRSKPVTFRFDGRSYQGFAGDTLASALIAHGQHMVARSFKYHRPRGFLGAGSEDPAGLVQLHKDKAYTLPNTRATEVEIFEGLEAFSQNRWPALRQDVGVVNDALGSFLPAGFYYKTFMGPPANWMTFEPLIRKSAGLGVAPEKPDPDRYEHVNRHCDVLVAGGGPAGLAAAKAAAETGARVILAEETPRCGGRLLQESASRWSLDGQSGADWADAIEADLRSRDNVTVLTRACVSGYYTDNFLTIDEDVQDHQSPGSEVARLPRRRLWRVRARQVILATGAIERPLVFHGNDRPGIMLAGAVRAYLHRYGVKPGSRAVVFANNDNAWQSAIDLVEAGIEVAAIVDPRRERRTTPVLERALDLGVPVHTHAAIVATSGRELVSDVQIARLSQDGQPTGHFDTINCDLVAVSGGWSPNVALFSQSRGKLRYDEALAAFRPAQSWQAETSVGAANGDLDLRSCVEEGLRAGREAAQGAGFEAGAELTVSIEGYEESLNVEPCWEIPSPVGPGRTRAFVDWQNDVTAKDLHLAVREGYTSVEHAKRYTTLGMGTDQGKTSNMNGFGILAGALGKSLPEVGVTTFRPPYKPVTFGAVAGQHVDKHFHPRRTTPMHGWHEANGAVFEPVGDWLRARVYRRKGESFHDALQRESLAARTKAGVLDASTLGKIDIRGPDAREFLNRVYTNAWLKLPPGKARYGLMLNEDGMVFDDGVTACLADDHFHMTTTTGGAAGVLAWLEDYLQTEWPDLRVYLTSVTEQWAVASLCGPNAPAIAADLVEGIDTDPEVFPFMAVKEATVGGIPVRVFRISFTGEVSYEINIPARYGRWLWERVMAVGEPYGLTPYGTEGMHLLRAEAGFIIAGQDTDGTVTPHDLGMSWAVKSSADFIGKRSLSRSDTARSDRRQLVGLTTQDPKAVVPEGSQIIAQPHENLNGRTPMQGHVTSSYFSPNLQRAIAFALIEGGHSRHGETVYAARKGKAPLPVTIGGVNFLKEHERQKAEAAAAQHGEPAGQTEPTAQAESV